MATFGRLDRLPYALGLMQATFSLKLSKTAPTASLIFGLVSEALFLTDLPTDPQPDWWVFPFRHCKRFVRLAGSKAPTPAHIHTAH